MFSYNSLLHFAINDKVDVSLDTFFKASINSVAASENFVNLVKY